jgi:hypothetical protein
MNWHIANIPSVSDIQILARDIVGDAATSTANKVNPSEDQLAQIDKPAEDNTWHDVPDLSKDNLKSQLKSQYDKQKPFGRGEVEKAAGDATAAAHPTGERDPAAAGELAAEEQRTGQETGLDANSGLAAGKDTLKASADQNVPEETKERQRKYTQKTKEYFGKKMPKERREQTIWRLKKAIVEIQGHQDCKFFEWYL